MDETLRFFTELLRLTTLMVDDIMPDMLLHLDQENLENLMAASQEANSSLKVFAKLCDVISRKNLSRPGTTLVLEGGPLGEAIRVVEAQQSLPPQSSSAGDSNSVVTNFSDLTAHIEDEWKGLLTEARIWYAATHHKEQKIPLVYYCGVCNKQAKAKHIWEAHLGGKTHMKLLADVDVVNFVCGTCGLHVCGEFELVRTITCSEEHHAFDTLVRDNRHGSSGQSTTSGCLGKDTPKMPKAELSVNSEVSDIKPSISAPSSTKSNPSVASRDLKPIVKSTPKVSKVVFLNTEIHPDFVNITEIIAGYIGNHEAFAIGYCRPCEVICESKLLWNTHKNTPKHKSKISSKHYNNVLCRCLQCEFVITAGLKIAVNYMKYHIEHCHHQSTDGIKVEEYMEVKNLFLATKIQKSGPGSRASSFKGSIETIDSVCGSGADLQTSSADLRTSSADLRSSSADLRGYLDHLSESRAVAPAPDGSPENPQDVDSGNAGQRADQSTSASSSSRSTSASRTTSANPCRSRPPPDQVSGLDTSAQINSLPAQNNANFAEKDARPALDDLELTFLRMLFRKEESFKKDTTFALFTALCAVCKRVDFPSQISWTHHVVSHTQSDSEEISCVQCNTHFFGDVGEISTSFINHDYHTCIDAMFSW